MFKRRRRFYFRRPSWWVRVHQTVASILLPLTIFQLIRTVFFPTTFDVMIFLLLIALLAVSKWPLY